MTPRTDRFLSELKRAGLKLTSQRIAIVRELADDVSHPTAQALFERLRSAHPKMSFATVYNTLDALSRCGLVQTVRSGEQGGVRFDPNPEPHHHAICDACGDILDVPVSASMLSLPPAAVSAIGFRVLREQRTYRGLCSSCSTRSLS